MYENTKYKSYTYINYNINSTKTKCFLLKSVGSTEMNRIIKQRERHLLIETKRFLIVRDVMEMMDMLSSYAYKLIQRLNAELESEGFVTTKGSVSKQYFMERICGVSTDKAGERWQLSRTKRLECGRGEPIIRI